MLNIAVMFVCLGGAFLIVAVMSSRDKTPACAVAMTLFVIASPLAFIDLIR